MKNFQEGQRVILTRHETRLQRILEISGTITKIKKGSFGTIYIISLDSKSQDLAQAHEAMSLDESNELSLA